MRVIAGKYKGRRFHSVPGQTTRPTTDKVKEAAFHMIGPYFNGGRCLDLFAGSGSLGIEALSRGIDEAIFIDKSGKAIQTIKQNLKTLKVTEHVEVYRNDAFRALKAIHKRGLTFQLILLDPPYKKIDICLLLETITSSQLLAENGYIYCEHDVKEHLPQEINNIYQIKQHHYGDTSGITIYTRGKNK
ncbi:16S rRNA (guanine(966)-N(2))-methyltransferase RsmD [Cerasibacillus quisquiliarum]|uniref:Putative rRNA methyltransferase YlbH n=1 Tax=Cerasibacillus quisquiliarum TaxID=227865 RepID=A0A511UUP1_9BACI|nr:16S rRNA (guanine(966)-N(2))-methyltransferase RsmD [Cerasibacillus quisquiliarum]GEN30325.1 putative rRNA methyltransferase YlbH [Cerasibacillus quisquiliarum]